LVKEHSVNLINNEKIGTYLMGLNRMSDWSQKEYEMMLGLIPDGEMPSAVIPEDDSIEDLPETRVTVQQIQEKFLSSDVAINAIKNID